MRKLFLICLLTISLPLRAEVGSCQSDLDKYKNALSTCQVYIDKLKMENGVLDQTVIDANGETNDAIRMASDENWGISPAIWAGIGLAAGLGLGIVVGRSLK